MKTKIRESDVLREVIRFLQLKRVFHFRCNTMGVPLPKGGFRPAPATGVPDVIIVRDGKFIGCEVKSPKGKLSPSQEAFRAGVLKAGGEYWLIRDVGELVARIV